MKAKEPTNLLLNPKKPKVHAVKGTVGLLKKFISTTKGGTVKLVWPCPDTENRLLYRWPVIALGFFNSPAVTIFLFILAVIPSQARSTQPDPNTIQALINDANDGDTIILQPGTYTGPGNYDIDFLGKALTLRSIDPNDPDTVAATIIDCNAQGRAFHFHTAEDANSSLEGLTITNGSSGNGGAIYCDQTSPTISRCVFTSNFARIGGAIYYLQTNATITQCVFRGNSTTSASAGAVRIRESSLTIIDSTFEQNFSWTAGGAITCSHASKLTLRNCIFAGNSVSNVPFSRYWPWGGALSTAESSITIDNCLFVGHFAVQGGALGSLTSDISLTNCTFSGNHATKGNTLYFQPSDKLYEYAPSHVQIRDSIVWDGADSIVSAEPHDIPASALLVTFTDIPGVWPGYGNIDAHPCFIDPGYWDDNGTAEDTDDDFWVNGDYHLKSQAGRWDASSRSWIADNITSPCIDTADPNTPLGPEPFPNGGQINMGVYGGTTQASKSYFGKPLCETIVAGDINGDCAVNSLDFALMAAHWLGQNHKTYPGLPANPNPANGERVPSTDVVLTWTPGSNALSHDVYLGTDYSKVRNALRQSPEYKANDPAPAFQTEDLPEDATYYWRIDELGPHSETTTGPVWSFTKQGKGRHCFPAATLVWVDGQMLEISKVASGAMVDKPALTPTLTELHKTVCTHQIERIDVHNEPDPWDRYDIRFENGNTLAVADSHYFLLDTGKWAPVQKLTPGSKLSTLDGPVTIKTIKKTKSTGTVYNLKIKNSDRYLIGKDGIIVRDW